MKKLIVTLTLITVFLIGCQREEVKDLTVKTEPAETERIILTPEKIVQLNNDPQNSDWDQKKFNREQYNTSVNYTNQEKGLSLEIPYNENWGNEKYKLNPYDESDEKLAFGQIINFESGWFREYSIYFLPSRSIEEAVAELSKDQLVSAIEELKINGIEAVKFLESGFCTYPTIEVAGTKYNYEFVPTCGFETEKEFEFLKKIIESMQLI